MIDVLLMALLPVFFSIGVGYAAGCLKLVDNKRVADLNAFVMQFAVPASLFMGIAGLTRAELLGEAPLAGLCLLIMTTVYGLWLAVAQRLGAGLADAAVQALTVAFPNLAAVALPILAGFDPHSGVAEVAVALAVGSIGPSALTLVLLDVSESPAREAGAPLLLAAIRKALLRPLVLAPIFGALLPIAGVTLAPAISASLKLLGGAAAGSALFLTGLVISSQPIRVNALTGGATFVMSVARPLAMLALVRVLPVTPEVGRAAVLMTAVPAGFFGILFGLSKGVSVESTGSIILLSYLSALVTLTTSIAFLYAP